METDFLPELDKTVAGKGDDLEENSIKYLALTILEALTEKAKKLSIKKDAKVQVVVNSFDESITLPAPTAEMATKIFEIMRAITHIEEAEGESPLAFGLRNGNLDLTVKLKKKRDKESLKFIFPELEPH
jgi:hypothetical protein